MSIEDGPKSSESSNEDTIKGCLYSSIAKMYEYVMFSSGVKWLGYGATVGFQVDGIEWHEPQLQRLLSQLHLKKDSVSASEYIELVENSVKALRSFDYTKEVLPEYHQEFLDSKCPQIIDQVANELEQAVLDAKKFVNM
ncbi:MAG: hypothetical protein WC693_01065 [Patescibacteria group bacterium]|jgi:hypothetical protein